MEFDQGAPRPDLRRGEIEDQTRGELVRRIWEGAAFDLGVLTPAALADPTGEGRVKRESRTDLAKAGVGLAVKAGEPRPDIGSVEAFMPLLLTTRSVAYIDLLSIASRVRSFRHLECRVLPLGLCLL